MTSFEGRAPFNKRKQSFRDPIPSDIHILVCTSITQNADHRPVPVKLSDVTPNLPTTLNATGHALSLQLQATAKQCPLSLRTFAGPHLKTSTVDISELTSKY